MSEDASPRPEEIAEENRRDEPVPTTHLRWAEALVRDQAADRLLHVTARGWHFWNGAYWELDTEDKRTLTEIAAFVTGYRNVPYEVGGDRAQRAFAAVARAEQDGYLNGVAAMLSRLVTCGITELDPDHWLLCVENGVLNLRSLGLGEHRQVLRQTMMCRAEWRPGALAGSLFEKAASEIFPGLVVREFVQEMLGCTLAGLPLEQKALVFHGPKAGNGKSTLLEAVAATLGSYARAADINLLTSADRHPEALADLHRRRLAVFSELPEDKVLAEAGFKRITGNDTVSVRHLYKDRFTFTPQFSVVIGTNSLPRVSGDDEGTWRRLAVVPCDVIFAGDRDDKSVKYKLQQRPEERAACLEWLVLGLQRYLSRREGFRYAEPEEVTQRTQECRDDNDVVGQFLRDCIVPQEGAFTTYADLYRAFGTWFSQSQGQVTRHTQRSLTATLKKRRGLYDHKKAGERGLISVRLTMPVVEWPKA